MEIITLLIIATIPVVGIAILFWIVRRQILSTSQTTTVDDISRLINERDNLRQEKDNLTRQIANLTQTINELTSRNREIQSNLHRVQSNYEDAVNANNTEIADLTEAITQIQLKIYIEPRWYIPDIPQAEAQQLRSLARTDYPEYLRTSRWRNWAEAMKDSFNHRCQACNYRGDEQNPLNVHHRSYGNIRREGQEKPVDLIVLCQECHQLIHNNRPIDGTMRPIPRGDGDC